MIIFKKTLAEVVGYDEVLALLIAVLTVSLIADVIIDFKLFLFGKR
jgi:hypothetical protein